MPALVLLFYKSTRGKWQEGQRAIAIDVLLISCSGAGFEVADAIALLRLDDLYIESFEIKDVKVRGAALLWDHVSVMLESRLLVSTGAWITPGVPRRPSEGSTCRGA